MFFSPKKKDLEDKIDGCERIWQAIYFTFVQIADAILDGEGNLTTYDFESLAEWQQIAIGNGSFITLFLSFEHSDYALFLVFWIIFRSYVLRLGILDHNSFCVLSMLDYSFLAFHNLSISDYYKGFFCLFLAITGEDPDKMHLNECQLPGNFCRQEYLKPIRLSRTQESLKCPK